jgi:predicted metalloprotease with PDZ domain
MSTIRHRIERDGRHELLITSTFPAGTDHIQLPVWRPGRYERGDFGQYVRDMAQKTDGGWTALPQTELHRWNCLKTDTAVEVRFRFTAAQLNAGSTWADDALLYVNPVNCLPYHPDLAESSVEIHLPDVPHTWSLATALPHMADSDDGLYLSARGTQELMDSPWIAAPPSDLWHGEYEVDGHTFHVHVWGGRHYDEAAFMEAHRKFTEAQMTVFGWLPVPQYHFLYLFPDFPARHGVEHEASTVIAWGPADGLTHDDGQPSPGMEEVIDIASHELVHTWNVKRLRPAEWMPYDFSQACPSRLGYVAEGVTTYLGDLFLLEAEVISMEGWLARFEKLLTRHLWNPGRLETSVADSSVQTWLDGYAVGVPHRRGNIYVEGAVLAFLCDVALNRAGGGWLMDALSELTGPDQPRALTEAIWWSKLEERASARGPEGAEEIRRLRADFCEGTEDSWPDLVDALLHQGVQATLEPHEDALARCGALCGKGREGRTEVKVCWPDSAAWQAGLRRGDVVDSTTEEGQNLVVEWKRDAVHVERATLPVPAGAGHFARPRLAAFPG